jgi:hypothetical protein
MILLIATLTLVRRPAWWFTRRRREDATGDAGFADGVLFARHFLHDNDDDRPAEHRDPPLGDDEDGDADGEFSADADDDEW